MTSCAFHEFTISPFAISSTLNLTRQVVAASLFTVLAVFQCRKTKPHFSFCPVRHDPHTAVYCNVLQRTLTRVEDHEQSSRSFVTHPPLRMVWRTGDKKIQENLSTSEPWNVPGADIKSAKNNLASVDYLDTPK